MNPSKASARAKTKSWSLGIDLGGTKTSLAFVNGQGKVRSFHEWATRSQRGPRKILDELIDHVSKNLGDAPGHVESLGVGFAGQVKENSGVVQSAPNLPGWEGVPLRAKLEKELGLPVRVTNDVRASTWGEWTHGAGKGARHLVCLFIGTGIGGGAVVDGQLLKGATHTAGEFGHTTVVAEGRTCHCRNRGCLEAYAGGWAIAQRAQEAVRLHPKMGKALTKGAGGIDCITATTVTQECRNGDLLAGRIVEETVEILASGLVSLVHTFNPQRLLLGGGVVEGFSELVSLVTPRVRKRVFPVSAQNLKILPTSLGPHAGPVGAAGLARGRVRKTQS